jgi:uncharacterized protein YjiS (DUF1127 family)
MPASATLPLPTTVSPIARFGAWLTAALKVARERRELLALDDHMLADIGLDRVAVEKEGNRPFWDLPNAAWPH